MRVDGDFLRINAVVYSSLDLQCSCQIRMLPTCITVAILAALVVTATAQQCSYDVRENHIIDVNAAEKLGAVFMSDVNSLTEEDCQSACCELEEAILDDGSTATCNLAIFHDRNDQSPSSKKCYLVFCPSEESCRLSKVNKFSSTFVTHALEFETTEPEEFNVLMEDYDETTESSTPLVQDDLTSSPSSTPTPEPDVSTSLMSSSSKPTSIAPSSNSTVGLVQLPMLGEIRRNDNLTEVHNDTAASVDDSKDGQNEKKKSVIASNGALIAAVCFGVIFLLAVIVILSKHWYEAYQRRHYSKVDYLINGMYN